MIKSLDSSIGNKRKLREVARVNPGETDFRTIITRVRSLNAPQVGVFLWPDQLLAFLRQARVMGLKTEIFGTDLCETTASISPDETYAEGCIYPDNQVTEDFRNSYRKTFNTEAQLSFAGSAYDMTVLVGKILAEQKVRSSKELLSALTQTRDQTGVLGTFSFRSDPSVGQFFEYPVRIKRIKDKRGVPVGN